MIQKLRLKLIMASILSLFLVLFVIEGIIGIMNYGKIIKDADRVLNILSENSGRFPERFPHESDYSRLSPEIPFESRFFSVLVDYEGNVILTDTGKIAAINETDAITYAQVVLEKQRERGFIDNYRYFIYQSETGERIIFLDCRRQQEMFQNLVFNAVWVSLLGLGSVFLLMVYLSSRIVKPFSDNYEKQKRFITDAGHELRTPLTIINADADILEMDFGENEWLADIQMQTRRMADLTNTLIVLSRMEEGLQTEMVVEFPLSDMAEEIVTAFQALAKVQQKELRSSIMPMILGNCELVSQLPNFMYIVSKTIFHSPPSLLTTAGKNCEAGFFCGFLPETNDLIFSYQFLSESATVSDEIPLHSPPDFSQAHAQCSRTSDKVPPHS